MPLYKQLLREKWLSIQQHIANQHDWITGQLFNSCVHGLLDEQRSVQWLTPDSPAHNAVVKVVSKRKLLNDKEKMTLFKGMVVRNMLAVMDHNENTGRVKATTIAGNVHKKSDVLI